MFRKKPVTLPIRRSLVVTLATLGTLGTQSDAHAYSNLLISWQSRYPDSQSANNLADACTLCHASSTRSQFNAYGWELVQNGHDFAAAESLNSDADPSGSTNLEELDANAQPGWTTGANNAINGGSVSNNALPPTIIGGDLDPTATNHPPTADANGPYAGTQGAPVTFDGSASSDTDGSIVEYAWDFGDGATETGTTVSHTYQSNGTYDITLTVTDDAGDSDRAATTATIGTGNRPPSADPQGPYSGEPGAEIAFDGNNSSDPDGSIASYVWDFGDGTHGTGATTSHTYTSEGTYNLNLTVTDDGGAVDSASTTVTIGSANQAPTANAGGPYETSSGEALVFDGTGSSDPDGSISGYAWDFGDGTTGSGATPSHVYTVEGIYNVSLTVTDDSGLSHSDTTGVTVGKIANQPPVAEANGPYAGTVGLLVSFDNSGSSDPNNAIVSYTWDFGDGASATGPNPGHTYDEAGRYNVTLMVTDNDGAMDSDSTTVTIGSGNLSPVANAGGPYEGTVDSAIQFDGSGSSDPDGSIDAYYWEFGDGSTATEANPAHGYATSGTYNVSLTVYDDNGAMDAAATTVEVAPVTTGADVDLSKVWVRNSVQGRVGRQIWQSVIAMGSATEVTQGAMVSLSVTAPSGVSVTIPGNSVSREVRPNRQPTQFGFAAAIACQAVGRYTLVWSATISADQNSETGNDTLTKESAVSCAERSDGNPDDDLGVQEGQEVDEW